MDKVIVCDCGYEVHTGDDQRLVEKAQAHAWEVHGISVSAELVLALSRRDDGRSGTARPRRNDHSVDRLSDQ